MRLKIRSPCKSPGKSIQVNTINPNKRSIAINDMSRKSPRVKEKPANNLLTSDIDTDAAGKKRPRTYLITDTPDHKQNTTIIRTKQEKIRKRFSFQQFSSSSSSTNTNSLPIIPDTPVKDDNRFLNSTEPGAAPALPIINSRCSELFKNTKIYSSPTKLFSPKKAI